MSAQQIPVFRLILFALLLAVPIAIFIYLRINKVRALLIAILRMVVQLAFVGLYLEYIFRLNNPWVNGAWLLLMILVANFSILSQGGLRLSRFFMYTLPAYLISILFIFAGMLLVFNPATIGSSRYFIPLGGMILGNILRGNIVALDRFYSSLSKRYEEYMYYVQLGASRLEALKPFMGEAVKAALAPQIGVCATMGLVSLPGMMTGQILGGANPGTAIQYQIMIMIAILVTGTVSVLLGLRFSFAAAFDDCGRLLPVKKG